MVASSLLDICRFNPSAGGTTDWTVSSAVQGYQTPGQASAVNGAQYSYRAESADLSQWELGFGLYNTSTGVLTRATVLASSTGSKVSFSTVPQVAIVALKEDLPFAAGLSSLTNSLGSDVSLTTANTYFTGPSVAQGTVGTWLATGTVTVTSASSVIKYDVKLWDGTTVIASAEMLFSAGGVARGCVSLSGIITSPAGNIRISVSNQTDNTGVISANLTGNAKDSTITAVRIA